MTPLVKSLVGGLALLLLASCGGGSGGPASSGGPGTPAVRQFTADPGSLVAAEAGFIAELRDRGVKKALKMNSQDGAKLGWNTVQPLEDPKDAEIALLSGLQGRTIENVYLSCDGLAGITDGVAAGADGGSLVYRTAWQRDEDRAWKLRLIALAPAAASDGQNGLIHATVADCDPKPGVDREPAAMPRNGAPDGTLRWSLDQASGGAVFSAELWQDGAMRPILR